MDLPMHPKNGVLKLYFCIIVRDMCHQYVSSCFKVQRLRQNSSLYWRHQALAPPLQHCHQGGHPTSGDWPQQRLSTNLVGHLHVLCSANPRPIIGEYFCTCSASCHMTLFAANHMLFSRMLICVYASKFCLSVHDCELSFALNYERYMLTNACAAFFLQLVLLTRDKCWYVFSWFYSLLRSNLLRILLKPNSIHVWKWR